MSADVLVVTALQLERRAVRAHLSNVEVETTTGLAADLGTFSVGSAREYTVAVVETGAGNVAAATFTARAEEAFRPQIVAMIGVAGGLKDVTVGDVVASSKVYWIEGGKQGEELLPRPDFAPVSPSLLQLARAVAADSRWIARAEKHTGGAWRSGGRAPAAFVAPIVSVEKVLASQRSDVASLIREICGDALAADMEDFGTLRGAASAERSRPIAIRGVSDLLAAKADADAAGSQPLAAANAAAFLFELLAVNAQPGTQSAVIATSQDLAALGAELYPQGPQQNGLWERAGGDASRLQAATTGQASWWHASVLVSQGGGGNDITVRSLLRVMLDDFPSNPRLRGFVR